MHPSEYIKESMEYRFIREHIKEDVRKLALQTHGMKDMNYPFAIRQISGYQHIVNKIPDWYACPDILFPPTLSLEQCSSQQTACYKRDLMKTIIRKQKQEQTISGADLTGGFGVDAYYLSEVFDRFFYVEKQPELCRIASHNFKALNRPGIQVFENESEEFLQQSGKLDFVYLDPSRRNRDGNKVTALRDCSPDPATLYEDLIKKAGLVLIKLSPMIDLSLALKALPHTRQIHVVALDNDCKEVLFLLDAKYQTAEPEITAVNLKNNAADQVLKFRRSDEANASCVYTAQVGDYLYEPNVSLLKAGAFIMPAQAYGLEKLHKNTHLYTSNKFKSDFPGKIFEVKTISSAKTKDFHKKLPGLQQANLVVRNVPMSVEALRKKLNLKEGGEDFVFACTLADESKVFLYGKRLL
ncbi:MAG: SAM-dependent methyltransferase [Bacteroidales bacterium]|jgi:16S rRNA G966 N2-methylase RsmD|nr:SAM-dependent methyltransferase [Bacteroidales bacterium]MBP8982134.1 SAM-dependent methyltransferase [Bacteroidales bacterium]NLV37853.1 SAM-dependent methyltransferase [Bacteroidales bacterium]HNZ80818.1 SAM-dependent methyltransferase [Bacteroidales bacterium]HOH23636.1 SAM-dependent methyltransferase [Bacteroidales bacterium]